MRPEERAVSKLSIYLLKDSVDTHSDIFEDLSGAMVLGNSTTLYTLPSHNRTPDWVSKFFGSERVNQISIFTAAARAVLIVDDIDGRKFAICFGYGKHMIKPGTIESRFGLKTALNIIDQDNLRSIDKTSLESVPKHSKEQISQDGSKESFGLNIEQDLVRAMTGKSKQGFEEFGSIVSGKDALYLNVRVDISNIRPFLSKCLERYGSNDYKQNFEWIDQISEVDDKMLRVKLSEKLVEKLINGDRDKIWASTPEYIEWSDVNGFAYNKFKRDNELSEDVSLTKILESVGEGMNFERLKRSKVLAISSETEQVLHSWSSFNCIYAEIDEGDTTYIITNGKWYQVNKNFVRRVNAEYAQIPLYPIKLPDYVKSVHSNENGYNMALARVVRGACLDADNISYGGGHSSIEFCDVYGEDKTLFHIKHYSGSSTLSHLFSQGSVSGELLRSDPDFRAEVNRKLPDYLRFADPSEDYLPSGQKIVFGIITHQARGLALPFFSKVNIRNARRLLNGLGFSVEIAAIPNKS